jgi:hypothetical protein
MKEQANKQLMDTATCSSLCHPYAIPAQGINTVNRVHSKHSITAARQEGAKDASLTHSSAASTSSV